MPYRKDSAQRRPRRQKQQRPRKRRLLEGVTPKKSKDLTTITTVPTGVMKTPVLIDLVSNDGSQSQSVAETDTAVTNSSSMLKRYEEDVKKDNQKLSPDPTLWGQSSPPPQQQQQQQQPVADQPRQKQQLLNVPIPRQQQQQQQQQLPVNKVNSPFVYSPMYRRYFGLTPPNPQLHNPRLLEDYIDWYINVYLEEELPWYSINIGSVTERVKKNQEVAKEEVKQPAANISKSSKKQ